MEKINNKLTKQINEDFYNELRDLENKFNFLLRVELNYKIFLNIGKFAELDNQTSIQLQNEKH